MAGGAPGAISWRGILGRGTVVAAVLTAPSLAVFAGAWALTDDLLASAVAGGVAHFVAMGFSLKVSRRLLAR